MARPGGNRRRWWGLGIAGAVAVAVVIVLASASDPAPDDGPDTSSSTTAATSSEVTFAPDEAHADLPSTPGCDQISFHATMAMFNPSLADELLTNDCPFPYDPDSVAMDGGEEDPSIDAPYEPRLYQDLFDVLTAERIGLCAISRLNEASVGGFVYGFGVAARADSCATSDPNLHMVIREYASRAHRDAHANAANAAVVQALARFVVTIDGEDPDVVDRLAAALEGIGAATIEH